MNKLIRYSRTQMRYAVYFAAVMIVFLLSIVFAFRAFAADSETAPGQRLITVHDHGVDRGFLTKATTLRAAFEEAGITTHEADLIEPGLDTELVASSYQVNVYRARPVVIIDGAAVYRVLTPFQTAKQMADQIGLTLQDEDITTMGPIRDIATYGAGLQVTIDRATHFTLVLYGKKIQAYTHEATVGSMLESKSISVASSDTVSVASNKPIVEGMTVEIWRNGKQAITVDESINFNVEQIQDADREPDYKVVKTPGVKGKKTVTYEIVMKNGKEVSRKKIQSVTIKKPVNQVEVVGAKFKYTGGPLSEVQINALGRCESGMNPRTNTGNGFHGAFQFMDGTWRAVAPAPYNQDYAYNAPLNAQKQAVQNLLSRSSIFTQFPGCAKQMRAAGII